ncbi:hypothetical protein NP233_g6237 [Leucocoprinus birnbaumii]|uniref:Uncharacterized protein n=1 Tax=Leucocoprinus birnbaumii TaxID=56174 RepID=A0AAD5VWZ8_9AGAR|nr:hypothetical protein NP233_g6237 [Leucocoprinus birnbaumii]
MLPLLRDAKGKATFHLSTRSVEEPLRPIDARIIGELDTKYMAIDGNAESHSLSKENLIIMTPNAEYLPHINLGPQYITFREDGRWGAEDWTQWPQWYFQGQEHFAFIPRKPSVQDLQLHPLRRLWWNMEEQYFVEVKPGIGRLESSVAQELYEIRAALMKEVDCCRCYDGAIFQKLHAAANGMRFCTSTLLYTPQSFVNTLLTVTSAQRFCLTTRALLDKITKWDNVRLSDDIHVVDNSIMGCVTDRPSLVEEMYAKGVPVWYICSVDYLPEDIAILGQQIPIKPHEMGVVMKQWKGAPPFYHGPHARDIHSSIENWRPGNLDIRLVETSTEDTPGGSSLNGPERPDRSQKRADKRGNPYPKPESSNRRNFGINNALFKASSSPYSPQPRLAWSNALSAVKRDLARVIDHPTTEIFRGYAFPPPHVFCTPNESNSKDAVLAWLAIRGEWMAKLTRDRDLVLPTPQQWRMKLRKIALALELTRSSSMPPYTSRSTLSTTSQNSSGGSIPRKKIRSRLAKEAAEEIFTIRIPSKQDLNCIIWYDRAVWNRIGSHELPLLHRQLAAWDCQEHNFRIELVKLDRAMLPSVWKTVEGAAERNAKFNALWPDNFVLMRDVPLRPIGLSAPNWLDRREFVEAFREIILAWPGEALQPLRSMLPYRIDEWSGGKQWDEKLLEEVEEIAAKSYCQVFFDYFSRAASVPPVLPTA